MSIKPTVAVLTVLIGTVVLGQTRPVNFDGLPRAGKAEEVRLSTDGLKKLSATLQSEVESNKIPGAVLLIARNDKIAYLDAVGYRDPKTKAPMTKDALFRIASMTKPITATALMILVDEGKVNLDDPVKKYIPEFGPFQIVGKNAQSGELEYSSAKNMATVRDLLRHTAGLGYDFGNSILTPLYQKMDPFSEEHRTVPIKDVVSQLVKLPIAFEPGTTWMYSMGLDVTGRLIEVVSGMPLDQFMDERIFQPLGMKDTAFWARSGVDRLAWPLGTLDQMKQTEMDLRTTPPGLFEGGGGLVSSAEDYFRFCEMLLNDGRYNGVRILKPESAKAMHTDQLPAGARRIGALNQRKVDGFGLAMEITGEQGKPRRGSAGDYYWIGLYGTAFWIDPQEKLIGILMLQQIPGARGANDGEMVRVGTYEALLN